MSDEDCEAAAANDFQKSEDECAASIKKRTALRLKYEAMLAQVDAWEARATPSEHVGLEGTFSRTLSRLLRHRLRLPWGITTPPLSVGDREEGK